VNNELEMMWKHVVVAINYDSHKATNPQKQENKIKK
jgi:hypothetical protein